MAIPTERAFAADKSLAEKLAAADPDIARAVKRLKPPQ